MARTSKRERHALQVNFIVETSVNYTGSPFQCATHLRYQQEEHTAVSASEYYEYKNSTKTDRGAPRIGQYGFYWTNQYPGSNFCYMVH